MSPQIEEDSRAAAKNPAMQCVSVALDLANYQHICPSLVSVSFFQGYFLLHRMASMVGLDEFDKFLFNYVQHFKGQLVASEVSRSYER